MQRIIGFLYLNTFTKRLAQKKAIEHITINKSTNKTK